MAEQKTKKTAVSVVDFLNSIDSESKRKEGFQLVELFGNATKEEPRMWGPSIIGFGDVHYKYESGHEGDWFVAGFSPRKAKHSLYLSCGLHQVKDLLTNLGKHSVGKGCLYINKLADVDLAVLSQILDRCVELKGQQPQAGV